LSVEDLVLPLLRPTRLQLSLLSRFYATISRAIHRCMRARRIRGDVTLQGSFAKGTILSDKWEIDVFLLLDNVDLGWLRKEAEQFLVECLGHRLPVVIKYSQQPYVSVSLMGMEADVVPVARGAGSYRGLGAERTPLHTEYVRSRLDEHRRDEVRLLKSFLRGIGVYGAETRTRGFSGYLAELLIVYYGSFRETLRNVSRWRPPIYIDPEGIGDRTFMTRKYRDSPLIVVDPVDPQRNAAAAVSRNSLETLVLAARLYLEKPHPWFFHIAQPSSLPLPPLPGWLLRIQCRGALASKPPDSVWGRLVRSARSLRAHLESRGFEIAHITVESDEYRSVSITILLDSCRLPDMEVTRGPSITSDLRRATRFIVKRLRESGGAWLDGRRLTGARPRPWIRRSAILASLEWLYSSSSLPLREIAPECIVSCRRCGEENKPCNPTPPWIASLLRA